MYHTRLEQTLSVLQQANRAATPCCNKPTSMWCSTVCCSVLQYVAVRYSALQCVAVCCSVVQCVAVCCSELQCVAIRDRNQKDGLPLLSVPMRCSQLQCVAVCYCVLQCVAVCCSALQCVAVCCSVLQCVAVCCSALQSGAGKSKTGSLPSLLVFLLSVYTEICIRKTGAKKGSRRLCNALQFIATHSNTLHRTASHCNTLQHTATHCIALHHTATHCNTLQHSTTHCNTLQHTATQQVLLRWAQREAMGWLRLVGSLKL